MKETIKKEEISRFNQYSTMFTVLLILTVVSIVPLVTFFGLYGFIPWGILYGITMYIALKLEKMKKDYDIQTYKEIIAFTEGKRLDEIQKQREIGKRPYQKVLLVITTALITIVVCTLIGLCMHIFFN